MSPFVASHYHLMASSQEIEVVVVKELSCNVWAELVACIPRRREETIIFVGVRPKKIAQSTFCCCLFYSINTVNLV